MAALVPLEKPVYLLRRVVLALCLAVYGGSAYLSGYPRVG